MTEFACRPPTPDEEAREVLTGVKTIAVVGLSPKPERPSHWIAKYLIQSGYVIIPIRPGVREILGQKAYPSLDDLKHPVDLVNIFRRPEAIPGIVEQAIKIGCKRIWMQEGISHAEAAKQAKQAGMQVVENKCIYKSLRANAVREPGP